ncbi:MAG: GNAT family protein [Gammaproteobacteria bacterium]|nr:GNAT family protein [Gammaproteobacteria bacterium]
MLNGASASAEFCHATNTALIASDSPSVYSRRRCSSSTPREGYCTEAVRCLINFAIEQLGMTRIVARCLARNPVSARVMEKADLTLEGCQHRHVLKNGVYEDILLLGWSCLGGARPECATGLPRSLVALIPSQKHSETPQSVAPVL